MQAKNSAGNGMWSPEIVVGDFCTVGVAPSVEPTREPITVEPSSDPIVVTPSSDPIVVTSSATPSVEPSVEPSSQPTGKLLQIIILE